MDIVKEKVTSLFAYARWMEWVCSTPLFIVTANDVGRTIRSVESQYQD